MTTIIKKKEADDNFVHQTEISEDDVFLKGKIKARIGSAFEMIQCAAATFFLFFS